MKTIHHNHFEEKQSIEVTIGSFIIITLLSVLYILSDGSTMTLIIAWPFVLALIIVNMIMFVHLAERFSRLHAFRKEIGLKILILLSNIPISFFYYLIFKHL